MLCLICIYNFCKIDYFHILASQYTLRKPNFHFSSACFTKLVSKYFVFSAYCCTFHQRLYHPLHLTPFLPYLGLGESKTSVPEVIKKSCSTQLSMKFFLLINVKMPTVVGILTFMSRKNSILGLYDPEKC